MCIRTRVYVLLRVVGLVGRRLVGVVLGRLVSVARQFLAHRVVLVRVPFGVLQIREGFLFFCEEDEFHHRQA